MCLNFKHYVHSRLQWLLTMYFSWPCTFYLLKFQFLEKNDLVILSSKRTCLLKSQLNQDKRWSVSSFNFIESQVRPFFKYGAPNNIHVHVSAHPLNFRVKHSVFVRPKHDFCYNSSTSKCVFQCCYTPCCFGGERKTAKGILVLKWLNGLSSNVCSIWDQSPCFWHVSNMRRFVIRRIILCVYLEPRTLI